MRALALLRTLLATRHHLHAASGSNPAVLCDVLLFLLPLLFLRTILQENTRAVQEQLQEVRACSGRNAA